MKTFIKSLAVAFLIFFTIDCFAQDKSKMIDLESALSMIGASKQIIPEFTGELKYHFIKSNDGFYSYQKDGYNEKDFLTIHFEDSKVDAVSWREYWDFASEYTFLLEKKYGFQGDKQLTQPGINILNYKNFSDNLTATVIHKYNDDLDHFIITIGQFNKAPKKVEPFHSQAVLPKTNNYNQVSDLPNPRNVKFSSTFKVKTKHTVEEIISYYKKLGAKNFIGNSFYLSSTTDSNDSCISIQIKKTGRNCSIEFGKECD